MKALLKRKKKKVFARLHPASTSDPILLTYGTTAKFSRTSGSTLSPAVFQITLTLRPTLKRLSTSFALRGLSPTQQARPRSAMKSNFSTNGSPFKSSTPLWQARGNLPPPAWTALASTQSRAYL
ncbi:unnamed protein product [Trichogramma brassicae]|uniref:Uncharacterized protein n=1 Tax=Trichogramma brassicae TaxID=86971 RepID=A0A6H5IH65_9HYME|nr:unnamed protein product [Trichogramma brassicae]